MAVGYLNEDWKDTLVATKERGRVFVGAVHELDGSAVSFHKGRAFRILDEDEDFIGSRESLAWLKENKDYGIFDDDEFEEEIVILIERSGEVDEDACSTQGIDSEELKRYWDDCNRYWVAEPDDEDDDY